MLETKEEYVCTCGHLKDAEQEECEQCAYKNALEALRQIRDKLAGDPKRPVGMDWEGALRIAESIVGKKEAT